MGSYSNLSCKENKELSCLLDLQKSTTRVFMQDEFDRYKYLLEKAFKGIKDPCSEVR